MLIAARSAFTHCIHNVPPPLCSVSVRTGVLQDNSVTFKAQLPDCASSSDVVYCARLFLESYNVTACVNLGGIVEVTPSAEALNMAGNLNVDVVDGKATLTILSASAIYRNALITGLVKMGDCTHLRHIYLNYARKFGVYGRNMPVSG